MTDKRYTIEREFTGRVRPQWVVRFCGRWIGARDTIEEARELASAYECERMAWVTAPLGEAHDEE